MPLHGFLNTCNALLASQTLRSLNKDWDFTNVNPLCQTLIDLHFQDWNK